MKIFILSILLSVSAFSCAQETSKVKHVSKMKPATGLKNIKVVNTEDPVCQMKTADYLKDTADYKGKSTVFAVTIAKRNSKRILRNMPKMRNNKKPKQTNKNKILIPIVVLALIFVTIGAGMSYFKRVFSP